MNIVDPISLLSVPLSLKSYNGEILGTATGFFWRSRTGETWLVSCYHVFSGNHYVTRTSLSHTSAFPAKIDYPRFVSPQQLEQRQIHTVELCNESGLDPFWKSHPIHDEHPVDVGIVRVPTLADDRSYVHAVNDDPLHEGDKQLARHFPGFELLIVGFFLRDRPTGYFPTYIRGSVASEMDVLYHGKGAFLIDALTSPGTSGSPVFAIGMEPKDPNAKFGGGFKERPRFVGIYSGRITEEENGKKRELQVGVVWRRELVFETVELA